MDLSGCFDNSVAIRKKKKGGGICCSLSQKRPVRSWARGYRVRERRDGERSKSQREEEEAMVNTKICACLMYATPTGKERAGQLELKKSYFYPPPRSLSWEKTGELF